VLAVSVAATACNPFGLAVYRYVVALGVDETIRTAVEEWRPPTMQTLAGGTFLIALLLVGGLLARRGRRLSWVELAAIGTFTVLALTAQRNVLWWAIAVTPLAAAMVAAAPGRVRSADAGHRAGNVVLLALVGVVGVASLPWGRTADRLVRDTPAAPIVDAVRALPDGSRLFVFQPWASWTELAAPGRPVFVDSRIELFAASTWEDYRSTISGGDDALATLGGWGVDAVVVPRSEGLADVLTASEDWRLDVAAGEGVLFVRAAPA
jgi:hypothetical protein